MQSSSNLLKSSLFVPPPPKTHFSCYFPQPPKAWFHLQKNPYPVLRLHFKPKKPLCVTCCKKENEPTTFSGVIDSVLKNLGFHVEVFKQLVSLLVLVFKSLSASIAVANLYKKGDLIRVSKDGVSTLAYVVNVSFFNTDFQSESGRFSLQNTKIDSATVLNVTVRIGSLKYFAIQDEFEIGQRNPREVITKIEDAFKKIDNLKDMTDHNVITELPNKNLFICCYVPSSSKLGSFEFKSYLRVRREVVYHIKGVIKAVISTSSPLFGSLTLFPNFGKSLMQPLRGGAPHGVVVSPLPNQRNTYSNLIRWEFLDVNDLLTTEVNGSEILGFVERKGWFDLTIKLKNGDRVHISKGKSNGLVIKFGHQMKNGERVNWRFTTELKIKIDQVERIKNEVYKIFEKDKDLEQEDSFAVVHHFDVVNRTAVLLVSCFTKTATHEGYFAITEAMLLKLHKLIDTTS